MAPLGVLTSIRGKLLLGFVLVCGVMGGAGVYGIRALVAAGQTVVDTYDKPLMAISFARSATTTFAIMQKVSLQDLHVGRSDEVGARIDDLAVDLGGDLDVVAERSLSAEGRALVAKTRALVDRWVELRHGQASEAALDRAAEAVAAHFDSLIERTASDSFRERQRVVTAATMSERLSISASAFAVLAAILIAVVLARKILRPLSAAAAVADRIAGGELETPIPKGGRDETGALLRSLTVMQDNILAMMERERARRRSAQARLVDALESSREAILLVDEAGCLALANSEVVAFLPERAPTPRPGTLFAALFAPLGTAAAAALTAQLSVTGEVRLDDGRWVRVSRTPTRDGGFCLIWSDITEMKAREEKLRVATQEAQAASAAKSSFLANVSHELRTPLNAIIGFSEIIAGEMVGPAGSPLYAEYGGDILASGRNLLGIINSVLELARCDAGTLRLSPEPVCLTEMLQACLREIAPQAEQAGVGLALAGTVGQAEVEGEPAKLRQVFRNLLGNAVKFSPAGSEVAVRLDAAGTGALSVRIVDRGIGMSADDIAVALSLFGQVDTRLARRYEGMGLGLPLANAFVALHGGTLAIDSTPGVGTTVTVTLPTAPADALSRDQAA